MLSSPTTRLAEPATQPGSLALLRRIRAFKAEATRLFPDLPDPALDTWPLREYDALALYDFLDAVPQSFTAVDIGTFIGLSSFCLALSPKVSRVISVDPNPLLHAQINEHVDVVGKRVDPAAIAELRVLDVARDVLSAFPEANAKIELVEGVVAAPAADAGAHVVDLAAAVGNDHLLGFVDGLHTAEGVAADLNAIFAAHADAIAVVDDCRHAWGPYVQAGIASFLDREPKKHRFTLLADVSASFAQSDLGFVYSDADATTVESAFARVAALYMSFDPLAMVTREEELLQIVADLRARLDAANAEVEQWRRALAQMERSASWKATRPLRRAKDFLRRA